MLSSEIFVYVWAYRVLPGKVVEFTRLYGPDGAWVRLFRQGRGYLGTHLYEDRNYSDRYITIDRWESKNAFAEFRAAFAEEFERLDREGGELTLEETALGELRPIDESD